ncbi:MAG TPA: NAD(P)H-dependent oxidoreductase [Candidatus Paceibacterota bacterium]|nr:NAD(P)H-dependent oxidoreductase [Candidatus Paceibacterota bacterium]
MAYTLLAISGSLRKESYNSALIRAWKELAPEGVTVDIVTADEIRAFPPYDQDVEAAAYPAEAAQMKERIKKADGVLVATPEYNRSVPGVLKNVIDWTSRPYGQSAWQGKPVFVMGATGGAIGTALAQAALKQVLSYLDARVPGQPEFYAGNIKDKLDREGHLTDESTKEHIRAAYPVFLSFIDRNR